MQAINCSVQEIAWNWVEGFVINVKLKRHLVATPAINISKSMNIPAPYKNIHPSTIQYSGNARRRALWSEPG